LRQELGEGRLRLLAVGPRVRAAEQLEVLGERPAQAGWSFEIAWLSVSTKV
jgi:hypothetical protein